MFNKNKILSIFLAGVISLGIAGQVSAADVFFGNVKHIGGTGDEAGTSVVRDSSGNIYTLGSFQNTVDFDPGSGIANLTSAGGSDFFIQKLDSSGNFVWVKQIGNTSSDSGNGMAIDSNNNIYITGGFVNTVDFDPGSGTVNATSAGGNDIFILKLDSSGNFVWVKTLGGDTNYFGEGDWGTYITVDSSDNVYISGNFVYTMDFDPGAGTANLTSAGGNDTFILKLDSSGLYVWAKGLGGTNWGDWAGDIAVDSSGNVYTTGSFQSTADLDPGAGTYNLVSNGNTDLYISKLDSSGNFVWAKAIGGTEWDFGNGIGVDSGGNVYVTGSFISGGAIDFDPGAGTTNLTSAGSDDWYLLKLDSSGNFVYVKQMGSTGSDWGSDIFIDSNDNVYSTGQFESTFDFDPGAGTTNLTSAGSADVFVNKFDSSGNFIYAKQFGGTGADRANFLIVGSNDSYIYTTGYFNGTADFDPGSDMYNLISNGGSDIFILKLSSSNVSLNNSTPGVVPISFLQTINPSPVYTSTTNVPASTNNSIVTKFQFTKNLQYKENNTDVKELQKFLNSNGYMIATTGPGSPGFETTLFGPATRTALIKYQKANNINPAVGYFGPLTRVSVNTKSW